MLHAVGERIANVNNMVFLVEQRLIGFDRRKVHCNEEYQQ